MKRLKTTVLFLLLAVSAQWAMADDPPDYYPDFFPHSGVVNQVNMVERFVVINDVMFRLSDTVRFHTPETEFESLSELEVGKHAGCRFVKDGSGHFIVTDIWLLSDERMVLPRD